MRRQPDVIVGFSDQVLSSSALVVEPHNQGDRIFQIGQKRHKHSIFVGTRFEQLISDVIGQLAFVTLGVTQRDKSVCLSPIFRLVSKFALLVSICFRRKLPFLLVAPVVTSTSMNHLKNSPHMYSRVSAMNVSIG